ncbi:MAG: hypothetical protein NC041_07640 [Bacteroides sp.]|nr:hypothetical protein [Prevotella sp.]MCM1407172.1 hypothetical protein [Treponema brennaborense]MCM1470324.1 hypothetical protein [Bacteroides sp.]
MTKTNAIASFETKKKSLVLLGGIIAAVALPQLFHFVGRISGAGTLPGVIFLPMHYGVFLAGLLGGPIIGLLAGIASPAVSMIVSGMPAAHTLPFMTIELAGYGFVSGFLAEKEMPVFLKVLAAQIAGRILRALAVLAAVYLFHADNVSLASLRSMLLPALPGILIQWAVIPLIMYRIEHGLRRS